jgi:hypothetical protein
MVHNRYLWGAAVATLALAASACNLGKSAEPTPDVSALYTVAAETLIAQSGLGETQTAAAASPTASPTVLASLTALPTFAVGAGLTPLGTFTINTPIPGLTPLPTQSAGSSTGGFAVGCNNAVYLGQTIADKTVMDGQKQFKNGWSLQNTGTCAWDQGYSFAFKSGEQMSGEDVNIVSSDQTTEPGHSQAFVVHLQAPKAKGEYIGYWQMKSDAGEWFGSLVSIDIIVG